MKKLMLTIVFSIAVLISFIGAASGQLGSQAFCGNGICDVEYGETQFNCPGDCFQIVTPNVIMGSLIVLTAIVFGGILFRVRQKIVMEEKAANRPPPMFPIASRVATRVKEKSRSIKESRIAKKQAKSEAPKTKEAPKKISKVKTPVKKKTSKKSTAKKKSPAKKPAAKKKAASKAPKKIKIKKAVPKYYSDTLKKLKKLKQQLE